MTWLDEPREESAQARADMAELRQELVAMEARIVSALGTQIADLKVELRTEISDLRGEVITRTADVKSDLMRWSFVFWCGAVAAIAALAGVLHQ